MLFRSIRQSTVFVIECTRILKLTTKVFIPFNFIYVRKWRLEYVYTVHTEKNEKDDFSMDIIASYPRLSDFLASCP